MKRKKWGRARRTERKKQTPNSLFSLSNSNHSQGEDGGMGERRKGGGGEEEGKTRRNMRRVERDSHTFLPQTGDRGWK